MASIYEWFSGDAVTSHIKTLSDNKLLNITNDFNSLLDNKIDDKLVNSEIQLPQLVVVGTQSSGKSTVLNAIVAMDLLPTGKNMVTRTPLDIRLHKILPAQQALIEIVGQPKIPISIPPSTGEISKVREKIVEMTNIVAGTGANISNEPIVIHVFSPHVPNLSLVDLPGLTMVACVDKGQPVDIKERIERLVTSYITKSNCIPLVIMQGRTDLETDLALALIKKNGADKRALGVLTKPDLMNNDNHVGDYIKGQISQSLTLGYGYFVVKNRSFTDLMIDPLKYITVEKEYFASHPEYKKNIYSHHVGMTNLTANLNKILITSIREKLPKALEELNNIEIKVINKLEFLGISIPTNKEGQMLFMNKFASSFYYKIIDSLNSNSMTINTGKAIKDEFIRYRDVVRKINPFADTTVYNDKYFSGVISNFEGNHMSFHIPPIQILEACINDAVNRPLMNLYKPTLDCIDEICHCLEILVNVIAQQDEIRKYPMLASFVVSSINDFILKLKNVTKGKILDKIKEEEGYIWTEDDAFKKNLFKHDNGSTKDIVIMLEMYYNAIKNVMCHDAPKIIMSCIIRELEKSLMTHLIQTVVKEDKLSMLKEDDEVDKHRKYYSELHTKISAIKTTLTEC